MSKTDCTIRVASWEKDRDILRHIRKTVFIEEQNVPIELEWDEFDDAATHFLALLGDKPCATARLKDDGQIGRMAVLKEYRNKKIGSQLLKFILLTAKRRDTSSPFLHAQTQIIDFYKKHGFTEEGEMFLDANILHKKMIKIR